MPSTYSPLTRAEIQAAGENEITWGEKTNNNILLLESAIAGMAVINMADVDYTLSVNFGATDEARCAMLWVQGFMTQQRSIIVPAVTKTYTVRNTTGHDVSIKTADGAGVLVKAGTSSIIGCNGTDMFSASSPTSDGSITPAKIDTSDAAWRLGSALGLGIAQSLVAGYGVTNVNGITGSRHTMSVGGATKAELNATTLGLDVAAAPGGRISFSTNSLSRVTINNDGSISVSSPLGLSAPMSGTSASFTGNVQVATLTATSGIVGLTAANVQTAQGFKAVAQGTGPNQHQTLNIRIGALATNAGKVRVAVENTDLGNIMFEGTQGIFAPVSGVGQFEWAAPAPGGSFGSVISIREANKAGAQGNSAAAAPGLALHWAGVAASQIRLRADAIVGFVNNPGTGYESIMANSGFFLGDLILNYSDMRLKTKIGDIDDVRARVRKLRAFRYVNNGLAHKFGYDNPRIQLGLSAGDVEKVFPEVIDLAPFDTVKVNGVPVSKSGENYKTVNYARLSCVLFDVVNAQDEDIAFLKEQLAAHQKTLTVMMNRLSALEN